MPYPVAAVRGRVNVSSGAPTPWWMASGVTPLAAYQAKGAASLAASYINLANPGTFDIVPGVAPSFNTLTGWGFNGLTQFLRTGVVPQVNYTIICQYNLSAAVTVFGVFETGPNTLHLVQPSSVTTYNGMGNAVNNPAHLTGNYGFAGYQPYRDGLPEPNMITALPAICTLEMYIGGLNVDGVAAQFSIGDISSFIVIGSTLTNPQYLTQSLVMP
jgi:hypothetical protein